MGETNRGMSDGQEKARAKRLADALRDNLRRRKQQGREGSEQPPSPPRADVLPDKETTNG